MNKRILSIDKSVNILTFVATHGNNCRLVDIQKGLDIPKSTLSGLVSSLEDNGLLMKNSYKGTYSLGLKIFEFGQIASRDFSFKNILRPYLEELSKKYNECVHLAICSNNEVLYIDIVNSTHQIRVSAEPGNRDILYGNSLGKIFMSHMSDDELDNYLQSNPIKSKTKHTILDIDNLKKDIQRIKKEKIAFDLEEFELGLICLSSDIINSNGDLIGAFGLSAPTGRLTDAILSQMQEDLISLRAKFKNLF